jgi:hypothetical protein
MGLFANLYNIVLFFISQICLTLFPSSILSQNQQNPAFSMGIRVLYDKGAGKLKKILLEAKAVRPLSV